MLIGLTLEHSHLNAESQKNIPHSHNSECLAKSQNTRDASLDRPDSECRMYFCPGMKGDMATEQNTPQQIWMPLILCITVALGMIVGGKMQGSGPIVEVVRYHDTLSNASMEGKIEELIRFIDARYVDDIGRDTLLQDAIESLMKHLDPHSEYLDPMEVKRLNETREGQFTGIGIEFLIEDDTLHILRVLPGSPAEEKGLHPGDQIIMADDSVLCGPGMNESRAADLLRGEQGSKVRLKIFRKNSGFIDLSMRRTSIRVPSVSNGIMLDSTIGYVRILRFGANTYREFMQAVETMNKEGGMQDLMMDLRGNPGGYLHESINILSQLFEDKDRLLVYTVGRDEERREYETIGRRFFPIDRLILLVDENSASASEIVAGAIQDWDRGIVVGRRTFGKGLVQEQYGLRDGSALVLTIARYYTPSGRSIQKDYSDPDAYAHDVQARKDRGELLSQANSTAMNGKTYSTYNGRTVYGGGGINPDVFLPYDTLMDQPGFQEWTRLMPSFQLDEIRHGRAGKSQLQDQEALWQRFLTWGKRRKEADHRSLDHPRLAKLIRRELLWRVAHYQGGESEKFKLQVRTDPEIRQAYQLFIDRKAFDQIL